MTGRWDFVGADGVTEINEIDKAVLIIRIRIMVGGGWIRYSIRIHIWIIQISPSVANLYLILHAPWYHLLPRHVNIIDESLEFRSHMLLIFLVSAGLLLLSKVGHSELVRFLASLVVFLDFVPPAWAFFLFLFLIAVYI